MVYAVYSTLDNGKASTMIEAINIEDMSDYRSDKLGDSYQSGFEEFAYVEDLKSALALSYVPLKDILFVNVDKDLAERTDKELRQVRALGVQPEPFYIRIDELDDLELPF